MQFAKLHGTGNDFVAIDVRGLERNWGALAREICDRHFGIGADGLLTADTSDRADVRMRIFNADGSEAEMSGNGMRCLVRFATDEGIAAPHDGELTVETAAGVSRVIVNASGGKVIAVRQNMGPPRLDPREIPLAIEAPPPITELPIEAGAHRIRVTPVSMGNPHAVQFQDQPVSEYPLHEVGPAVEHHHLFPNRANFEVVRVLAPGRAEMRVWERGVGETLSCGSGASAVMVAARLLGKAGTSLEVKVPGGVLDLTWDGEGDVILSGPVAEVFRGTWPD
jgi:diaminopimelate epimerase